MADRISQKRKLDRFLRIQFNFNYLMTFLMAKSPVSLADVLMSRCNQHQDESVGILASSEDYSSDNLQLRQIFFESRQIYFTI